MSEVVETIMPWTILGKLTGSKKEDKGNAAADEAKKVAEQKALLAAQEEEKKDAARKAYLATPTSGFGPNTNLARSFLTSL